MKLHIKRSHVSGMAHGTSGYSWYIEYRGNKFAKGLFYSTKRAFKKNLNAFIDMLDPDQTELDISEALDFLE